MSWVSFSFLALFSEKNKHAMYSDTWKAGGTQITGREKSEQLLDCLSKVTKIEINRPRVMTRSTVSPSAVRCVQFSPILIDNQKFLGKMGARRKLLYSRWKVYPQTKSPVYGPDIHENVKQNWITNVHNFRHLHVFPDS